MVCPGLGVTRASLAVILVPSLVVPIVVANLIGLGIWRVHKRHKRQRAAAREIAAEPAAGGLIAGAGGAATGEAVITAISPSGDSTSTVVSAGQSAAVPASPSVTIVGSTRAGTKTALKKIRKSDGSDMMTSEITGQHITINGADPEFTYVTRDGSPFTVWHVCIICQQPRSARYHSEHPIDANFAASPPQSICRRCASKSSSLPLQLTLPSPIPAPSVSVLSVPVQPVSAPSSPTPEPTPRIIPFRHVKPFAPELQHVDLPPPPTSTVEPKIASIPTIEIMPPRGPSYEEYLFIKRENDRRWSQSSTRDYPAPLRDYHSASPNDHQSSVRDYPASAREYLPPTTDYPAPFRDYPPPVRDRPAPTREYQAPARDYPLPARDRPAPLTNVKPAKRRVSFSRDDEVATLPPSLSSDQDDQSMQGLSRMRLKPPNLSGMYRPQDDYEYEKQRTRTYIDPTDRPYVPEPKWAPLSESPARELPLVEESHAHGPYRAENSPTPSMEVHVDNYDFVVDKEYAMRKPAPPGRHDVPPPRHEAPPTRQKAPDPAKQSDREWTRYVTVKEYRDEKGPYVEVEEKYVFDDER
ncbi:hypothetical protein D6C85_08003 [Aureobasidium pullulans]|uniref:Uncharacterized protein n=1 Tax=Aureobasidium pullulans TaxID=5580 RepID=A0A4S9WMD1_AURPU|nr:hypothetical protein D6C89_02692 [Aureobasidium pullulans]THZ66600.1 hypothetical protein D6C85_08003 [Aureobasidium pullulans]